MCKHCQNVCVKALIQYLFTHLIKTKPGILEKLVALTQSYTAAHDDAAEKSVSLSL